MSHGTTTDRAHEVWKETGIPYNPKVLSLWQEASKKNPNSEVSWEWQFIPLVPIPKQ